MKSINAIIRPASTACNLSCRYCYNDLEDLSDTARIMKIPILEKVIRNLVLSNCPRIKFLWHGGEPLLAGLDFYKKAVSVQRFYKNQVDGPIRITNTIQTNSLLLNDDMLNFFIENNFNFGVSLDGPAYLHDVNRPIKGGGSTHESALKNIKRITKAGGKCGIVCVVNKSSLLYPEEMLNFFISEGITNIHLSPYAEIEPKTGFWNPQSVTAEEYGRFIVKVFRCWKKLDNPLIKVRIIDNFLQGLLGGKMELCTFARNCSHHILIESSGDAFICGRNANKDDFFIGNMAECNINQLEKSSKFNNVATKMPMVVNECISCEWFKICQGGCSYYKLIESDGLNPKKEHFCLSYKMLLSEISEWIESEGIRPKVNDHQQLLVEY